MSDAGTGSHVDVVHADGHEYDFGEEHEFAFELDVEPAIDKLRTFFGANHYLLGDSVWDSVQTIVEKAVPSRSVSVRLREQPPLSAEQWQLTPRKQLNLKTLSIAGNKVEFVCEFDMVKKQVVPCGEHPQWTIFRHEWAKYNLELVQYHHDKVTGKLGSDATPPKPPSAPAFKEGEGRKVLMVYEVSWYANVSLEIPGISTGAEFTLLIERFSLASTSRCVWQ